jgi:outer membrane receptor protein involved in Fe transport
VLTEDGSITGQSSTLVNLRVGWRSEHWELALDVINLFDEADNDIEYYYASRLPGEAVGGTEDIHLHPTDPRTLRLTLSWRH